MSAIAFEPWEPEESIGKLWHSYVIGLDNPAEHLDAAATLDEMRGRIGVLFRGLGGARDVEFKTAPVEQQAHRLSWRRSLGHRADELARPSFDGEAIRLPERIAIFPEREANMALYLWLTATASSAHAVAAEADPLRADIRALQHAHALTLRTLAACRGLRSTHAALAIRARQLRANHARPALEAAVESVVRHLLAGPTPDDPLAVKIAAAVRDQADDLAAFAAPRGYKPFAAVPIWIDGRAPPPRTRLDRDDASGDGSAKPADPDDKSLKASRKDADQAARNDSLILHKFESILSWAEFLNLNRRVDDEDEDNARKAADDLDEINLARVPQKARARLRLHLDLSPTEADFEHISGKHMYPEWDHRKRTYAPAYCRVLDGVAAEVQSLPACLDAAASRRRIRSVRRQFEALRPRRVPLTRQMDGDEIDIDAALAARVAFAATGEQSDRVYRATRTQERDLAVSILLDASRSTESYVGGRQVIDVAREALVALAWGLHACGDETAIAGFSSLRRDRVFFQVCKGFDEPMGASVEHRIAGLTPGHYTRLGAALRHASAGLAERTRQRRLLLVVTDGKPNDLDHYEGQFGIEDTHMAVREAQRRGQTVFGVTIDMKSQAAFSRIFGPYGFIVVPDPEALTAALPKLYRHLVGG